MGIPQLVFGKNSFSIISRLSSNGIFVYKLVTSKVKKLFFQFLKFGVDITKIESICSKRK